ncbi:MAG: carbon starvation protein A [Elusimicrobia bacterium]|nr:carbon starvation protein A [Candidatus Obscuribacterium magneticum]
MHALPILIVVLSVTAIAYRYYSAFLAAKVMTLDAVRPTPAHTLNDGQNYHPTNKWILFGHHFAAISGAGPLIGPVLAAQFGYLPGLLWLVVGVVIGGAVQDFIILVASIRRDGKSLAEIAKQEIGRTAGLASGIAILFIVIVALAGLGFVVVNALAESSWGTFTIAMSIPIALFMGVYIYRLRAGVASAIPEASLVGVVALLAAVVFGRFVPEIPWLNHLFLLNRSHIIIAMMAYGFMASVLPVWLLLCPRDYLSSYLKIGTVAVLILGVFFVNPTLKFPAISQFTQGGPIVPGSIFPFLFITIMCGAISGFHALVASGTTPKMISSEIHARPIGYGCMLMESLVGVVCLIATCSMEQGDYYAINVPISEWASVASRYGFKEINLEALTQAVGEANLRGRTGGSVLLAVGMAQIFTGIPGMGSLMKYWYHFAIMFEALFILTTIDTGTRVARFLIQEFLGKVVRPLEKTDWLPGTILSSGLVVGAWGWLIWNASIRSIWPMFGIANQMLAAIALCVGTVLLLKLGRARYVWVTLVPMLFVIVTTTTAGIQMITRDYWPASASRLVVNINEGLIVLILVCAYTIFVDALVASWRVVMAKATIKSSHRRKPVPSS